MAMDSTEPIEPTEVAANVLRFDTKASETK
jgi:hypothetical protein